MRDVSLRTFKLNHLSCVVQQWHFGCESHTATRPRMHHLADSSQSQLCTACLEISPASSGCTAGCAKHNNELTSGWDLRSHCSNESPGCHGERKKKQNWSLITHNVSVCFKVDYLSYNCNMWWIKSQTTCFTLFLTLLNYHISLYTSMSKSFMKLTYSTLSITLNLWHLCSTLSRHSTSWCHIYILVNIVLFVFDRRGKTLLNIAKHVCQSCLKLLYLYLYISIVFYYKESSSRFCWKLSR